VRIVACADGDRRIGYGHVMRVLALAEAVIAAGGAAWLSAGRLDAWLALRARTCGVPVERRGGGGGARRVIALARAVRADWVVADSYRFGHRFQEALRRAGLRVLLLDDYGHAQRYSAELVLNPNASASARLYRRRSPRSRLLLGPRYALLRPEFGRARRRRAIAPLATRILVTLGGSDARVATRTVISALDDPRLQVRVLSRAQPAQDMARHMAWADIAIAGAGTTALELCRMGVPALLVVMADNQRPGARALHRHGAAISLGWHARLSIAMLRRRIGQLCADPRARSALARRGRRLVDGKGAARVLAAMGAR
jgi:spore coat polysaccharide biosynthesis predicted glycosyltransferase SpsG